MEGLFESKIYIQLTEFVTLYIKQLYGIEMAMCDSNEKKVLESVKIIDIGKYTSVYHFDEKNILKYC